MSKHSICLRFICDKLWENAGAAATAGVLAAGLIAFKKVSYQLLMFLYFAFTEAIHMILPVCSFEENTSRSLCSKTLTQSSMRAVGRI